MTDPDALPVHERAYQRNKKDGDARLAFGRRLLTAYGYGVFWWFADLARSAATRQICTGLQPLLGPVIDQTWPNGSRSLPWRP